MAGATCGESPVCWRPGHETQSPHAAAAYLLCGQLNETGSCADLLEQACRILPCPPSNGRRLPYSSYLPSRTISHAVFASNAVHSCFRLNCAGGSPCLPLCLPASHLLSPCSASFLPSSIPQAGSNSPPEATGIQINPLHLHIQPICHRILLYSPRL